MGVNVKDTIMCLEEYIESNDIRNFAVYGMNEYGKKWYQCLKAISRLEHVFGIEKLDYSIEKEYEKYMLYEDQLPPVDAILIVPWKEFDFVTWELYSFVPDNCKFVSIQNFADKII